MQADLQRALAPLVGLPLTATSRASNMLSLQLGDADAAAGGYALHVFCAWRLVRDARVVAGSGDLFTPADPDEDLDTFDYDAPGATWWDVRLAGYLADAGEPPRVRRAAADALGGARLELSDGATFEIFPNSAAAEHFETEFWRLLRPGTAEAHVVVGTFGIDRVPAE
jgi:hypothetical protein